MKYLFVILLTLITFSIQAQGCNVKERSYKVGESLEYKIGYYLWPLWIKAGQVNFSVNDSIHEGDSLYHFVAQGKTFPKYDFLYKVRDKYESIASKDSLQPVWFKRDVLESDRDYEQEAKFDFSVDSAYSDSGKCAIHSCAKDVVTAVYYCRDVDWSSFKENDTIPLSMYLEDSVYNVYVRYLGKEPIKCNLGKFNTIKFAPLLIEGTLFKAGEGMTVWVTDDKNKIPLRVESPILVGNVRAEIYGFRNLKYPLSSIIEEKD